jgi:hypothetical protein
MSLDYQNKLRRSALVEIGYFVERGGKHMRMLTKHLRSLLFGGILTGMLVAAGVATALEVGQQAPDFTLPSTMGEKVSLSQFRGQNLVLIEFYSNDFVPT